MAMGPQELLSSKCSCLHRSLPLACACVVGVVVARRPLDGDCLDGLQPADLLAMRPEQLPPGAFLELANMIFGDDAAGGGDALVKEMHPGPGWQPHKAGYASPGTDLDRNPAAATERKPKRRRGQ